MKKTNTKEVETTVLEYQFRCI